MELLVSKEISRAQTAKARQEQLCKRKDGKYDWAVKRGDILPNTQVACPNLFRGSKHIREKSYPFHTMPHDAKLRLFTDGIGAGDVRELKPSSNVIRLCDAIPPFDSRMVQRLGRNGLVRTTESPRHIQRRSVLIPSRAPSVLRRWRRSALVPLPSPRRCFGRSRCNHRRIRRRGWGRRYRVRRAG
jgi:hypothetical protein